MVWTIYHNPRCSKSRDSLALLRQHGIEPNVVHYLDTPPDADTLTTLLRQLAIPARQLLRDHEPPYLALGLASVTDEATVLAAIAQHPVLLQRPIISNGSRAVIGRPPDNLLALLPEAS
ncbi:MAG: arsenate reductase (glutaredoxin) [Pseudomonadota bacterium]